MSSESSPRLRVRPRELDGFDLVHPFFGVNRAEAQRYCDDPIAIPSRSSFEYS